MWWVLSYTEEMPNRMQEHAQHLAAICSHNGDLYCQSDRTTSLACIWHHLYVCWRIRVGHLLRVEWARRAIWVSVLKTQIDVAHGKSPGGPISSYSLHYCHSRQSWRRTARLPQLSLTCPVYETTSGDKWLKCKTSQMNTVWNQSHAEL